MTPGVTLADYWMGRDLEYALALDTQTRKNAAITVELANKLIAAAALHGVVMSQAHPVTGTLVSSGWRPPAVNAATPRAATNSKHMTGRAIDLYDPDGDLDEWLMTAYGRTALEAIGLWLEHPASTKGWCHVQTVPPGSGNRVFYP